MEMLKNQSLRQYNSFGIEASARYFTQAATVADLQEALAFRRQQGLPLLVLGGGSNILLTKDVDGLVLKSNLEGIEVVEEGEDSVLVRTGAGENWHRFVLYCVEQGFAGVENLSLIPGSNGASPMQNIGAYGVEIKDVFHSLEAIRIEDGSRHHFTAADCEFGYRESVFKRRYRGEFIITSVTYRLGRKPSFNISYGAIAQELERMGVQDLSLKAVSQAVINIRSSKLPDPREVGNAGSFFKNPLVPLSQFRRLQEAYPGIPSFPAEGQQVKVPAGWLIEQCGWKGYRKGDAGCYPLQALVLVNWGSAKGEEIYALSEEIVQSVKGRFGIELEREVNII
jgi:UDP-N-acetylmuramate dehydrogenase